MIFEVPTPHFPPSTDASKEVKKTAHVSPFEKYLSKEMSSMDKALGVPDKGFFSSFKNNTMSSANKIFESNTASSAPTVSGMAESVAKKFGDILSSSINLSM